MNPKMKKLLTFRVRIHSWPSFAIKTEQKEILHTLKSHFVSFTEYNTKTLGCYR